MAKEDTVDQLRTLNELFSQTGTSAPDSAEHVRRILDFISQAQGDEIKALSLAECVDRLARLHFGSEGERGLPFAHWNISADPLFSPLWIRQSLIARMKQIAGYRKALLLITGLREAVCPPGSYWTKKRQEHYDRVCDYIHELVCVWSAPSSKIQLMLF